VSGERVTAANNTNFQGDNTLRKLRGARTTLGDRESSVNRDLSDGMSLMRTSEGGNIAATVEAAIYDDVAAQLGVVCGVIT
jgi:hypothetical protein